MRQASTRPCPSSSLVEDSDGLAESTQAAPWHVLSALASEYAHAVRHPTASSFPPSQTGHVQQELQVRHVQPEAQTVTAPTVVKTHESDLAVKASPQRSRPSQHVRNDANFDNGVDMQAARLEAAEVSAKFVSAGNARTELVLRFDFMNSRDTRASTKCTRRVSHCIHLQSLQLCRQLPWRFWWPI